jgi:hypothetical protein
VSDGSWILPQKNTTIKPVVPVKPSTPTVPVKKPVKKPTTTVELNSAPDKAPTQTNPVYLPITANYTTPNGTPINNLVTSVVSAPSINYNFFSATG